MHYRMVPVAVASVRRTLSGLGSAIVRVSVSVSSLRAGPAFAGPACPVLCGRVSFRTRSRCSPEQDVWFELHKSENVETKSAFL